MPNADFDPKVIEDVTREVRGFGEDIKKLSGSVNADIEAVRKIAEEVKSSVDPLVTSKIDALTASVVAKQEALENSVKGKLRDMDARLSRPNFGGGATEAEGAERKAALNFHAMVLASRGQLKSGMQICDEDVDFAGIKSWSDAFPTYLRAKDDRVIEAKALSVGSDPDGGYWVTPQASSRIISQIYESSPIRQLATVETISTDALEIPNDLGEFASGWVGESEDRAATSTSQTGVLRIPVHEQYASPRATQKLLEDSSINVVAWLTRKVAEKFGRDEATAFVSGNGIKKPRGFLSYASGTTNPGTIEQVASGAATALTADGLINLQISLKEAYVANASWLMRRATVGKLLLLKDGEGQYLWRQNMEVGKPSVLLGNPVYYAADMPAVGAGLWPSPMAISARGTPSLTVWAFPLCAIRSPQSRLSSSTAGGVLVVMWPTLKPSSSRL